MFGTAVKIKCKESTSDTYGGHQHLQVPTVWSKLRGCTALHAEDNKQFRQTVDVGRVKDGW